MGHSNGTSGTSSQFVAPWPRSLEVHPCPSRLTCHPGGTGSSPGPRRLLGCRAARPSPRL